MADDMSHRRRKVKRRKKRTPDYEEYARYKTVSYNQQIVRRIVWVAESLGTEDENILDCLDKCDTCHEKYALWMLDCCKKRVCDGCYLKCPSCSAWICKDCAGYACDMCRELICQQWYCANKDVQCCKTKILCKSCTVRCSECTKLTCRSDGHYYRCSDCSQSFCCDCSAYIIRTLGTTPDDIFLCTECNDEGGLLSYSFGR